MTMFRAPVFTGAATITFFTPVEKYGSSVSVVRNLPLHSSTMSTCCADHGTSPGFALPLKVIDAPSIAIRSLTRLDAPIPSAMHGIEGQEVRGGLGPAGELVDVDELRSGRPQPARKASRPMRPKPLIPILVGIRLLRSYSVLRITVALDGHADVNSIEVWTVAGTSALPMRRRAGLDYHAHDLAAFSAVLRRGAARNATELARTGHAAAVRFRRRSPSRCTVSTWVSACRTASPIAPITGSAKVPSR